jgi:hypothetical protein
MSRFKGKPIGGLPGRLPPGEDVLWQGAPEWRSLARQAFRIRIIAGYFGLLVVTRVGVSLFGGHGLAAAATTGLSALTLAAASLGLFLLFAWLIARSTTYTITARRAVITYGMALPKSVNLPFTRIDAADLRRHPDGTGDLALKLPPKTRLSYLLLWPHVRAGASGRTEPVLRCIGEPEHVAGLLAAGLTQTLAANERAVITEPASPGAPALSGLAA